MKIEDYFKETQSLINSCRIIRLTNVAYEKRGTYEGFIRGELYFADDSLLHFREFIDVEVTADRLMYAYQYLNNSKKLIFRYDNTGHHKKAGISTYPHHKHEGSDNNVISSKAPKLSEILQEIELLIRL